MVQGTGSGGRIKESDVLKFHEEGPPAPRITPLAMEIAKQEGLDIFKITGTGEGGKITKEDVERALAAEKGVPEEAPSEVTVIPMKGIRKVIADNMHASLQNTAQLSVFTEVDVTEMVHFRDLMREEYKKEEVKMSYNDIIIMATAYALKRHPSMNSTLVGDEIILHNAVHMGIAVALKEGLIVPKLRHADKKSLLQIAKEARELAGKARKGVLGIDEVTDGTFTIIIRQMMTLSLTFDHRVVDGAPAMTFLKDLARYLQEPMLMLP